MSKQQFPRYRLFWRLVFSAEHTLGRLPMLILLPTAGAIIGTAWAVSHPSEVVRHGLVVAERAGWIRTKE